MNVSLQTLLEKMCTFKLCDLNLEGRYVGLSRDMLS
jgi:hypothetical protein